MKNLITLFLLLFLFSVSSHAQQINLTPGSGFDNIKIGDSFESVQKTLGFGKKKSYNLYVADELFDRNPDETLECLIGFDHYIKYEYLLTLPVHFIYFKDDKVVQLRSTSFPEYYHSICEDVVISSNIKYWGTITELKASMGEETVNVEEDYLILDTYHYLSKGISFSTREKLIRTIHIYNPIQESKSNEIVSKLSE